MTEKFKRCSRCQQPKRQNDAGEWYCPRVATGVCAPRNARVAKPKPKRSEDDIRNKPGEGSLVDQVTAGAKRAGVSFIPLRERMKTKRGFR